MNLLVSKLIIYKSNGTGKFSVKYIKNPAQNNVVEVWLCKLYSSLNDCVHLLMLGKYPTYGELNFLPLVFCLVESSPSGVLSFFFKSRHGPASTVHPPKKNTRNFKHPIFF